MNIHNGRQVDAEGRLWFEREDRVIKIGFTQSFLDSLDQCWHILPANLVKFKEKAPLLTVETNDSLISIMSPVAGNFMNYSDKAQNFPDKLLENDVILELQDGPVVRAEPVQAQQVRAPRGVGDFMEPPRGMFRNNMAAGAVPAPPAPRIWDDAPRMGIGIAEQQRQLAALNGMVQGDAAEVQRRERDQRAMERHLERVNQAVANAVPRRNR